MRSPSITSLVLFALACTTPTSPDAGGDTPGVDAPGADVPGVDGGLPDTRIADAPIPSDVGPDGGPTTRYVATHFVTPTATGGGDGSRESPWTWAEAYQNASAGNRVQFAPGTYTSHGNDVVDGRCARTMVFGPRRSGTEAEPIVFFAEYPAIYNAEPQHSLLYLNGTPLRECGTVTGARPDTAYVTWDGFSMRQGPENQFGSEQSVFSAWGAHHLRVLRCLFDQQGQGFDEGGGNNWGAIFMQVVHHVEIADCIFRDIPGADENTATYLVYGVGEVEFHHSLLERTHSNFNIKGVQEDADYDLRPHRIHHNRILNWDERMVSLIEIGSRGRRPGEFCDFYQNVFSTMNGNLGTVSAPVSSEAPRNVRFVNNTFYGNAHPGAEANDEAFHAFHGAISPTSNAWRDSLFQNNVVHITGPDVTDLMAALGGATAPAELARFVHRYNHYSPSFADDDFLGGTFAAWQAMGQDTGSLRGDPMFRAAGTGDLRLAAGSPALGAGRDVLGLLGGSTEAAINMGAYVLADQSDLIGVRPQGLTDTLP